MLVPPLRFGNDHRPIRVWRSPWWAAVAVVIAVVLVWAAAMLLLLPMLALVDAMARAVLPTRLRERCWDRYAYPHPGKCPACGCALSLREGLTQSPIYEAECTGCGRVVRWINGGTFTAILDESENQQSLESPRAT